MSWRTASPVTRQRWTIVAVALLLVGCCAVVGASFNDDDDDDALTPPQPPALDRILTRHVRASMMIDMRGFPDTEGNCIGEGFQRNQTDCTQFFRCVDFNRNGKYTIFRFMCGPMAVFDQSRSLCTGPELSVPPCPQDQLDKFFVMMKPDPQEPASVTPTIVKPPSPPPPRPSPPPPRPPPPPVIVTNVFATITETQTTALPPSPPVIVPTPPVQLVTQVVTITSIAEVPVISQAPPVITSSIVTELVQTTVVSTAFSTVFSTVFSTAVSTVFAPASTVVVAQVGGVTEVVAGFITVGDRDILDYGLDAPTSDVPIPVGVPFGFISQGNGSVIVIEEPSKPTLTITLPPGAILIANATQNGGVVTNVANGLITTSTSVAAFPAGTAFWIAILGGNGEIVRWQQVVVTMGTATITLPAQTFIGLVTIIEQRVVAIAGWTYTIHYVTTTRGYLAYVILQVPASTSLTQSIITTTSTYITGSVPYISGIITIGGLINLPIDASTSTSDLVVPGNNWLAVIPQNGKGIVTISETNSRRDVIVQPGEILAVWTPGQGVVTQVIQQSFTSPSSIIKIPAGSTVSLMKVTTDGRLVAITTYNYVTDITIITTVYSTVGVVRLVNDENVYSIGQGKFTVQSITNYFIPVYFGVWNLNTPPEVVTTPSPPVIQVTTTEFFTTSIVDVTTITSIIENLVTVTTTLEPSIVEFTSTAFVTPTIAQTITITQPATTFTQIVTQEVTTIFPGEATLAAASEKDVIGFITVGDVPNQSQTADILVPVDSQLAVVGQDSGSTVTIQETGASPQTFTIPSGAVLMVSTVQTGGVVTNVASSAFTTSSTTCTFPPGTTFWLVTIGSNGQTTKWTTLTTTTTTSQVKVPVNSLVGLATIVNQRIVSIANWVLVTQYITTGTTTTLYGVLRNPTSTTNAITTTSTTLTGDNQFISGIIAISQLSQELVLSDLTVPSGQLLVVIPSDGQGVVSVAEEGGARDDFDVTPGSMLGILAPSSGPGSVTQLNNQIFTTEGTKISFPAGSTVSVLRVGTDGRLIRVSSLEIKSTIVVTTSAGSIVGIVGTSNDGVITSIGSGRFTTQQVTGAAFGVPVVFGVVNFNTVSTTSFLAEALTGVVQIGAASYVTQDSDESQTQVVALQPETTHAVMNAGDFLITEQDGITTRRTTFTIPSGSALGIVTSASGGEITGVVSGYFTSSSTKLTFPSGAQFGIMIVRLNGTPSLVNTITTNVKTTVTVPNGSLFGQVKLDGNGLVTGIGSAVFSTQFLLLRDTTGPDVPAMLGHVGVVHHTDNFDFSRFLVTSTSKISSDVTALSAILLVNAVPEQSSINNVDIKNGESLALIPNKGQGEIVVNEGGSTFTFTVLPGQIFGAMDIVSGRVTSLKNLVFTTESSVITFGAGTTFGVVKIGDDGKMLSVTIMRTASSQVSVSASAGSAVGVITSTTERRILAIGGADFVVKSLAFGGGVSGSVGVIDLSKATPPPAIVTQPTRPPQPPIAGPFALDCDVDTLHQFPLDCSRFYQCAGDEGKRTFFIFPCAPGLIFDESRAQCRSADEAKCDDGTSITDLGLAEAGNVGGFFEIDCSGELFRYPLNCKNFYQCFKNEKGKETIYVYSCATGLVFDDATRSCLKPEETSACGTGDNLFRSPSFVFQLGQSVDRRTLVSRARSFVRRLRIEGSSSVERPVLVKQLMANPAEASRGASKSKMTIHMSKSLEAPAAAAAVAGGRQGKVSDVPVAAKTRTFQRVFDSGIYGTRIVPRAKSSLIQ